MRVAAIQHDIAWEDPAANYHSLDQQIAAAAAAGAQLIVLTEMFPTGFSMRTDVTAEPVDGPSLDFLAGQAAAHGAWVGGSFAELPDGGQRPFNTFALVGPYGAVHRYRKLHPFTYSGEHHHFAAGSERVTVNLGGLRVTMFVCYDLRFADEFWVTAPDTDVYLVPANWPSSRRTHWTSLLQARAIENQAWVVGVNRVGRGGDLDYAGDSRIIDPMGEVVAAAAHQATLLVADVDAGTVKDVRARLPFLADRR